MQSRSAPKRFDRNEEKPKAQSESDQALSVRREAERKQGLTGCPAEREPPGEKRHPHAPERGGFVGYRHDTVARRSVIARASRKQHAHDEERDDPSERRHPIREHNPL